MMVRKLYTFSKNRYFEVFISSWANNIYMNTVVTLSLVKWALC